MVTLYAWLAKQPDGEERLVGVQVPGVGAMPAVTVVEHIAALMGEAVRAQALIDGVSVRLVRFKEVEDST